MTRATIGLVILCLASAQAPADPPGNCSDDPVFQKQLKVHRLLKKLLRHATEPKMKADALFRLAENYVQMSHTCPALLKENQERAIKVYRKILAEFPDYPRRDEVLFLLATSLWDLKRSEEALKVFMEVAKPGGKFAPDAFLAFGEYYFEKAQMEKAIRAYQKVIQYPDSPVSMYARYKLGWVYYNLQEWKKSAERFRQVIELTADKKPRPALYKEAIKDYVRVYSHFGGAKEAPQHFLQLAPGHERKMLEQLASTWFGDGKYTDSIGMRRHLIRTAPSVIDAAFQQLRIVGSTANIGDKRKVLSEVEELAGMLKRLPPAKSERHDALMKEAQERIEKLAKIWTIETQKAHPEARELSRRLNELYRSMFPDASEW